MIAVTTFSHSGYEAYGREMLKSAINNWPFSIVCYIESDIDLNDAKLEKRNFFDIEGVMGFYQNIKNVPICHGRTKDGYNYNYDLWKFSRKMFAQWDVLKEYKGKVFWLDADSFIRKPIPEEFLVSLFDDKGLTYLGREGVYTETGFVGFDTENEKFPEFLKQYIGFIRHGWFMDHARWHDCEAFDFARRTSGIPSHNLSPFFKIPKNRQMSLDDLDVFGKSVLGEYIVHLKGKRKEVVEKYAVNQ